MGGEDGCEGSVECVREILHFSRKVRDFENPLTVAIMTALRVLFFHQ